MTSYHAFRLHNIIFVYNLQVRGSIPLPWQQIVDLTYKPKYELLNHEEGVSCYFISVFLEVFM